MKLDCRHPGCRCMSRPDHDGYCSTHCQSAGAIRSPTGECQCGHPGCGTASRERVPLERTALA
jgi:hypothetical protein